MARLGWFAALLLSCQLCSSQQPSRTTQAFVMDLRGPAHTTLMEIFDYVVDPKGTSAGSVFSVYDLEGYILEENRYDPHGSLIVHRKYTRSGSEIFKLQHMNAAPGESRTTVQSFNADGLVAETDTYDGNDALNSRIINDYAQTGDGVKVSTSEETNADGSVWTTKTFDSPTRQLTTKDGKPDSDSFTQRDTNGKPLRVVVRFADGSYNERTVQPDGATVQHSYWSQTKIDTYLTTDAPGHWLETIQESTRAYVKTKFQYDEAGRRIEVDTYDRSGKLVRKTTTEYEDDANGSWTEERDFDWDVTLSEKPPKLSTIRRRTITYY